MEKMVVAGKKWGRGAAAEGKQASRRARPQLCRCCLSLSLLLLLLLLLFFGWGKKARLSLSLYLFLSTLEEHLLPEAATRGARLLHVRGCPPRLLAPRRRAADKRLGEGDGDRRGRSGCGRGVGGRGGRLLADGGGGRGADLAESGVGEGREEEEVRVGDF